ncbi:MAG: DUF2062 domain-containing protein [Gammaproteobacteria bacterium]|jgi:uncharacterized protein (DUF2062 family)
MPKKFIKKYMPDHEMIRNHPSLNKVFGTLLHDPNLLHLNRRSVSAAFAVGLFMAFVPVPFQMVLAAATAILVRCNLPISVGLVWVSNPVTIPPLFYFCYLVGTWILGSKEQEFAFELSVDWLTTELGVIWQPFLLGCAVVGVISAMIGFFTIRLLWRMRLVAHLKQRKLRQKS